MFDGGDVMSTALSVLGTIGLCVLIAIPLVAPQASSGNAESSGSERTVSLPLLDDEELDETSLDHEEGEAGATTTADRIRELRQRRRPPRTVVVRYYATEGDDEPIAIETFPEVHVRYSAFTIELGSHDKASGNWQCREGHPNLDALLAAHQAVWYTVAYKNRPELNRRTRLTEQSRTYCHC